MGTNAAPAMSQMVLLLLLHYQSQAIQLCFALGSNEREHFYLLPNLIQGEGHIFPSLLKQKVLTSVVPKSSAVLLLMILVEAKFRLEVSRCGNTFCFIV